jgi:hypothetical protein
MLFFKETEHPPPLTSLYMGRELLGSLGKTRVLQKKNYLRQRLHMDNKQIAPGH